jgi:hypothetical protein
MREETPQTSPQAPQSEDGLIMAETRNRTGVRAVAGMIVVLVALLVLPGASQASYVHKYSLSFELSPSGEPSAVAVDTETENVYLLTTEGILEKFTGAGVPSNFSAVGKNWIALKCGEECRGLAVDNSRGSNQGVIYVGTAEEFYEFNEESAAVEVFLPSGATVGPIKNSSAFEGRKMCGVAVGASGELYVNVALYNLIDRYVPASWAANPNQSPPITATIDPIDFFNACKISVDSTGALYVGQGAGRNAANALRKFMPSAFGPAGKGQLKEQTSTIVGSGVSASSVDMANNDVYLDHKTSIERLDSAGNEVETFGESPQVTSSFGVAVNDITKNVYVGNRETGDVSIYSRVITPDITDLTATTGIGSAALSAHVDPVGAGDVSACTFEYREEESSFTPIPCDQAVPYASATDVTATVPGASEGVNYEYRLKVANANGTTTSPIKRFSLAPPAIEGVYSAEVQETQGTLFATIDPKNAPTEFFFEIGPTPDYGATVPVPTGSIPGGVGSAQKVSAIAKGLEGRTTYHFRVVAISPLGRVESDDQTFHYYPQECPNATVRQQTGGEFLPDCRAYELVTPRVQGNAILNPGILTAPPSYATNPARMTFGGVAGGINGTEPVIGLGDDVYLSTRTSTGWVTTLPGLHGNEINGTTGKFGDTGDLGLNRFIDFSGQNYFQANPEDPEAEKEGFFYEQNIPFVWNADGSFEGRWPALYSTIRHAENINGYFQPSPDFSHLAFTSSSVPFAPNGLISAPGSAYDYDVNSGTIQIISRLQGGADIQQQASIHSYVPESNRVKFESGPCDVTNRMCKEKIGIPGIANGELDTSPGDTKNPAKVNPGVSTNGSHILMSTSSEPYDVFTGFNEFPPVHLFMRVDDAITYDVSKGDRVKYVGMTSNGSKVFFTSTEQLTPDDHDASADLYMWSQSTDQLTRLSVGANGTGDTDSCSAEWTSQCDVSPVMWTGGSLPDTGLSSENGEVYFYSPEQLDGEKGEPNGENIYLYRNGAVHYVATGHVTRMDVSPDGTHMAFITDARITGYDNHGDEEMYSYTPASDHLVCVSCNPTGASPVASVEGSLNGLFMANDGRTFFYTLDALVPKDTNKLYDVYEYTEGRPQLITTGVGSHDRSLNTSGQVRDRAAFTAVSADGVNVYFDTYETLVPEDENGEFLKYYDARTGGGFPVEPPLQPCVAADECHGTSSSPPPPTGIVSDGNLGSSGNSRGPKKSKAKKRVRRGKAHHKRGHSHRHRRRGNG